MHDDITKNGEVIHWQSKHSIRPGLILILPFLSFLAIINLIATFGLFSFKTTNYKFSMMLMISIIYMISLSGLVTLTLLLISIIWGNKRLSYAATNSRFLQKKDISSLTYILYRFFKYSKIDNVTFHPNFFFKSTIAHVVIYPKKEVICPEDCTLRIYRKSGRRESVEDDIYPNMLNKFECRSIANYETFIRILQKKGVNVIIK